MKRSPINTFVINLAKRPERRVHILKEFEGRKKFSIHLVEPLLHEIAAISLWNTIKHILQNSVTEQDEFIILCEDDHQFTAHYSKEQLLKCIESANAKDADILSGGVSWFEDAVQASENLFWIKKFSGLQFTVIFKKFYISILKAEFCEQDVADFKISSLSANKFLIHPFISIQKEFGYSDVTLKNNGTERVEELFVKSAASAQILKDVFAFYKNIPAIPPILDIDQIAIPTYIINLPERTDRREHVKKEFAGRKEFDISIVEACRDEIGAVGLWQSIRKIIQLAIANDDDVILICEDDHEFTAHYSKERLIHNIIEANEMGVEILSGGIGGFRVALPVSDNRIWINSFYSTQFLILYKRIFDKILNELFDSQVTADGILSEITTNKMTIFPFISIQKEFGYSDVTQSNNTKGAVLKWFDDAASRLELTLSIYNRYQSMK